MKLAFSALFLALAFSISCANNPVAQLTHQAQVAYYGTQVIQVLDLTRDTIVAASTTTPPLVSVATATRFVAYHKYAIQLVHDAPSGWQTVAQAGLDAYVKSLSPSELAVVTPYVALLKAAIQEAS